jgi:hypothetical protein
MQFRNGKLVHETQYFVRGSELLGPNVCGGGSCGGDPSLKAQEL